MKKIVSNFCVSPFALVDGHFIEPFWLKLGKSISLLKSLHLIMVISHFVGLITNQSSVGLLLF
jgi:hypothetical protein